jgi:TolA-binding protein
VYLVAAALCVGALAYAAVHQRADDMPGPAVEAIPPAPVPTTPTSGGREHLPAEPVPPAPDAVTPDSLPSVAPPSRTSVVTRAVATARATQPGGETFGPAELFARANDARRANDTKGAIALYEELQSKFPDSREASTSRVALGRLLLDRAGDPTRARALFSGYLDRDPAGPLAEEARVGRALAAMRLGDGEGERVAWQELLERHPGSVHAARARQRLSELGN